MEVGNLVHGRRRLLVISIAILLVAGAVAALAWDNDSDETAPTTSTVVVSGGSDMPAESANPGAAPTSSTSTTAAAPAPAKPSQTSNCAPNPHLCGYPDATNTGVPAGTALKKVPGQLSSGKGWHVDSRGWIAADGAGAVLDGIDTELGIEVTADNVTVKNSRIVVTGEGWGVGIRHARNVTVQDSTIFSPYTDARRIMVGIKDVYGDATGTKVLRNNIYHWSTGVQTGEGLIQDNYIHDPGFKEGDHINGTTSNGSTAQLHIIHNTVFNSISQTDAISLFQDFGLEANRLIDNNLVAGGGYCIYGGGDGSFGVSSNIKVTNNRFAKLYFPNCGGYGPLAHFDDKGAGNVFSGNVWDDTGKPVIP